MSVVQIENCVNYIFVCWGFFKYKVREDLLSLSFHLFAPFNSWVAPPGRSCELPGEKAPQSPIWARAAVGGLVPWDSKATMGFVVSTGQKWVRHMA